MSGVAPSPWLMKPAAVLRRAIIRAAHEQTARLWPPGSYPDAVEMTASMLGTTAEEVRRVALGEAQQTEDMP